MKSNFSESLLQVCRGIEYVKTSDNLPAYLDQVVSGAPSENNYFRWKEVAIV